MSKHMLDPIIRALVGVPESRLGTLTDITNRLNSDRGEEWDARFKAVLREGLSAPVPAMVAKRYDQLHQFHQLIQSHQLHPGRQNGRPW